MGSDLEVDNLRKMSRCDFFLSNILIIYIASIFYK